jgi:hypothetical protein
MDQTLGFDDEDGRLHTPLRPDESAHHDSQSDYPPSAVVVAALTGKRLRAMHEFSATKEVGWKLNWAGQR